MIETSQYTAAATDQVLRLHERCRQLQQIVHNQHATTAASTHEAEHSEPSPKPTAHRSSGQESPMTRFASRVQSCLSGSEGLPAWRGDD